MPIPTQAPEPEGPQPVADRGGLLVLRIAGAGAAYAFAELIAGIAVGGFFAWGRAEALIFLALRPWLLLVLAALIARKDTRIRIGIYAAGLLLAALGETILIYRMGGSHAIPEAARGVLGGALLTLVFDLLVQLGRHFHVGWGRLAGVAAGVALLVLPFGLPRQYEAIVMSEPGRGAPVRPELMLMSALPLRWGELGPLDARAGPASAYRLLEQEFAIRTLDVLDEASLWRGRLLLLAQPRGLAPSELVALDAWVRRGGRALILTDPTLVWPSDLPLGDVRRPPAAGLLGPLLGHWGLSVDAAAKPTVEVRTVAPSDVKRRLTVFAAGRLSASTPQCAVSDDGLTADCRIGQGRVVVLADADLLNDRLWTGAAGAGRHTRIADNPLVVADYLDRLSGLRRDRAAGDVQWADPAANRTVATLLALLPLLVAATPGLARTIRRRR